MTISIKIINQCQISIFKLHFFVLQKHNPFASHKQNHYNSQFTKFVGLHEAQSLVPGSNQEQNNHHYGKNKSAKKMYARSTHTLSAEKAGDEKQFKIDVVEMTNDVGNVKVRLANKDILSDHGICVHSKKGNSLDHIHNMSDYFVYIDGNIKLISVFMGHGAYGNFVSNLACRLVFKHFFREPLIQLQPQIGFKRLFMNVDKFISQHILFYELEETYNCMLSGACCTLVLIEQNNLFVASLGNTQAFIFRQHYTYKTSKSNYLQLSGFHLPTNRYERERIHKNTGEIRQWKNDFIDRVFVRGRTFPGIEVTRCFGNDVAKMIGVINEPDIYYYEVSRQSDQFLLVTTPNFFDYISYEEVYSILNSFNQKTVKKATEVLLKRIKSLQTQDMEIISDLTFALYYFF